MPKAIIRLDGISHYYGKTSALDNISLELPTGKIIGFIGPDGVGKSSLLGLIAGIKKCQQGQIDVLSGDMRSEKHRNQVCNRIAYMPQGLGKNLYQTLSVKQNIMFFAQLFGLSPRQRITKIDELLNKTGLAPFADRPAGKLSGGMKQKLGLCCALVHKPDLLILDEPTTGVDPLSRRQFWALISNLRQHQPDISILVATAYMDEAQGFDWLVAMNAGKILSTGTPEMLIESTSTNSLESAFIELLPEKQKRAHSTVARPSNDKLQLDTTRVAIEASHLTLYFDDFKAVDDISLTIKQGEIFGFIGSNGCGKTTTMKMLTGLLSPSEGAAQIFGQPVDANSIETRKRIGYMSQSFSLYTELSVEQNLVLHARLFDLPETRIKTRSNQLLLQFGLEPYKTMLADKLPLGIRQRLSLAVAMIHSPELLILDEPTSGVDPIARDEFWQLLQALSRKQGVTIFISTHFMNEAARCDRISLMDKGRILATDSPQNIIEQRNAATLEEAFIDYLQATDVETAETKEPQLETPLSTIDASQLSHFFSWQRMFAFSRRETMEVFRDPILLSFSFIGTIVLMLIFGYGITLDVDELPFTVLDQDQTPHSRQYAEGFRASPYFSERPAISSPKEMNQQLTSGKVSMVLEIPSGFGRALINGQSPQVMVWVDGSMPFRGSTVSGYVSGVHRQFLEEGFRSVSGEGVQLPLTMEVRFNYNQDFKSIYSMVPAVIALLLIFIPAILMALGVVREKELGSITNFYATPATRLEFLLGKQLPYIGIGMFNYFVMLVMALFIFDVPLKGSFFVLTLAALLYVIVTTGIGLLMSTFTRTQIAALAGTAIISMLPAIQFSGLIIPVSALDGSAYWIGQLFPTTYFLKVSVGSFTKGMQFSDLSRDILVLLLMVPVITLSSWLLTKKQDA